jgi:tRNA (guanine37-N1)-methyltransferase
VPEALLSGDHDRIRRWRRKEALRATRQRRPDLLKQAPLTAEDERLLREIEDEESDGRQESGVSFQGSGSVLTPDA